MVIRKILFIMAGIVVFTLNGCNSSDTNDTVVNTNSSSIELSTLTEFTTEIINDVVFYDIYRNLENGDPSNPVWSELFAVTMKFENGTLKVAEGISETWVWTYYNVSVVDGIIEYTDNFNMDDDPNFVPVDRYIKIGEAHEDYLEVCYGSDYEGIVGCGADSNTQEYFYIDPVKAQAFMDSQT